MNSQPVTITAEQLTDLEGLDDWRYVLATLQAEFRAGSFAEAAALAVAIADAADRADHHPDVDLRYPGVVRVTLTTHALDEVTDLDVSLARTVSALAAGVGASARPCGVQQVEVAIDTMEADRIRPFWAAVLDYRERNGNLVDPRGQGPAIWFQELEQPRPERNRLHLDISVPHDEAESRIEAALAAGGVMVSDRYARAWWVLADPDGNEACICTWQERGRQQEDGS